MSEMFVCFRGNVNTWECDEMGHMNVRFYLTKAAEGMGVLAGHLGVTPSWLKTNNAMLKVSDQHIRYMRELHAGPGIIIEAGILNVDQRDIHIYQAMRPTYGDQLSATIISHVSLIDRYSGAPIDFPSVTLERANNYRTTVPENAGPRSIPLDGTIKGGSIEDAISANMVPITLGRIYAHEIDEFGYVQPDIYMGRISDGIVNFMGEIRNRVRAQADQSNMARIGGAALEYRFLFHDQLRAGDLISIYAGLKSISEKTMHVVHWSFNATTGALVARSEAIAVSLDLEKRKIIPFPDVMRKHLEKNFAALLSA